MYASNRVLEISFNRIKLPRSGVVVLPVASTLKLAGIAAELDKELKGAISKAMKSAEFNGKKGKTLSIVGGVEPLDRVVVFGIGDVKTDIKTVRDIQSIGGQLYSALNGVRIKNAQLFMDSPFGNFSAEESAAQLVHGMQLKAYTFDKYFTKRKDDDKPALTKLLLGVADLTVTKKYYDRLDAIAKGVYLARDVISEPPNKLYPESYANIIEKEMKKIGVKVTVLGEKQMEKLGMGSLLGVGQGSIRESKLVVMEYTGARKRTDQPIAFVGKGVTFDTGGISIKPAGGMEDMKYDMGGSAAVVGVMYALAARQAKVNAVGVVGLVENMPDGNAQRPSDVVTSMSGQTIEVLNTDAEGRLVLADALWYTQDKFSPKFMVNLATLTGAITIALGDQYAGLFSNNDELSERLLKAGEQVQEKLWRFPLNDAYDKMIDSKIADMQNISNGRGAGSITAAQFLQRFVNKTPWAHLDIAGMAWVKKPLDIVPEGAVGYGVRLLDQLVANHYEG